jgi:septum formation protein
LTLILASTSAIRRQMLEAAGVEHSTVPPGVEEDPYKAVHERPEQLAYALAAAKALKVSRANLEFWVVGSDSVVTVQGIGRCDKPESRDHAREQLRRFSDRRMHLTSAVALARNGELDWQYADTAILKVRELSDQFIEEYLDGEWPEIGYTAGAFRLEARGAQLFDFIEGSHFTILGMPLLPLLRALRERGMLTS